MHFFEIYTGGGWDGGDGNSVMEREKRRPREFSQELELYGIGVRT